MTKLELINQLKDMDDYQEVRVSLSGDPYTFGIINVEQSKLKDLSNYIRISINNYE